MVTCCMYKICRLIHQPARNNSGDARTLDMPASATPPYKGRREKVMFHQVIIWGHSLGAAVAVALASKVCQQQWLVTVIFIKINAIIIDLVIPLVLLIKSYNFFCQQIIFFLWCQPTNTITTDPPGWSPYHHWHKSYHDCQVNLPPIFNLYVPIFIKKFYHKQSIAIAKLPGKEREGPFAGAGVALYKHERCWKVNYDWGLW